ncbi:MAG: hypothetical protein H7A37_07050 [Chlamydiales bacterium]|nr:hypothetical protein [Chlamydiales bacterium]
MKWFFAENNDGQESGISDAGIETFKGGDFFASLARELVQNSIDARANNNKPVEIHIHFDKIQRELIPDVEALSNSLKKCLDYWPENIKAKTFFEQAVALINHKKIPILRIGDYNTRGVQGADCDRKNDWYNLIKCSGSSAKASGEGGSYGIGKNAPFASSSLRTVFYSTKTIDGQVAFQGVAKLVTHEKSDKVKVQPTGYLSINKSNAIRDNANIPDYFKRSEPGTDIVILGFKNEGAWKEELTASILQNFWYAIQVGDLVVKIDTVRITKDNLEELLESNSKNNDFDGYKYYQAFKNPSLTFKKELPLLGEVCLYLSTHQDIATKKIAMMRKTGMIIFYKLFRSASPFCGVFICRNSKGNQILRSMEPPRHDDWDPNHPEKKVNKKTQEEFLTFIRESIKELNPIDESKSFDVPDLHRFLPDELESGGEPFSGESEPEKNQESFERHPKSTALPIRKIEFEPICVKEISGDLFLNLKNVEEIKHQGNDSNSERIAVKDAGQVESERSLKKDDMAVVQIEYRTFPLNVSKGVYVLNLRANPSKNKRTLLQIMQAQDDGNCSPLLLESADSPLFDKVPFKENILGPLSLRNGENRIEFKLKQRNRVAIEVRAYEID